MSARGTACSTSSTRPSPTSRRATPLLIVIDDFHWADHGTLLLTSFLLRSTRPGPMLVLGTYRDTELGRHTPLTAALAELKRSGALDRIDLRGLPLDDVAWLARSVLGSDEIAPRVHARTAGNAFFVEEVLRELVESGPQVVPESVRHAVGVRLSRMSDDANELIAAAAILGLEHDVRALQATAGLAPDAAEAALDELLRARLLRPAATAQRFEFTHALVREVVHDESNVLRRARLHRRAAEALSALGEDSHLDEIGMHLFEAASAADAQRAAEMLERAGRRALDRLAYEDAADRFARALDALELAGAEDDSGPVLLARGDALARAGDPDAARVSFTAARTLALRRSDPELLANAALGFAGLGIAIVGLDTQAIARLEEALDRVADAALRSRLQARLAVELYYAPDRARSEALSAEAVATAEESGDAVALASALGARHVALWRPDRVEERLAVAARDDGRGTGRRRPPRGAPGAQLARLRPLRARRHDSLAQGGGPARATRGGASPARLPVVHAAVGSGGRNVGRTIRRSRAPRRRGRGGRAARRRSQRRTVRHPGALRRPNPARGLRRGRHRVRSGQDLKLSRRDRLPGRPRLDPRRPRRHRGSALRTRGSDGAPARVRHQLAVPASRVRRDCSASR